MVRPHHKPETPLHKHVALIGFMGAGKTSVGKLLAERLGSPFVDLDEVIAEKAKKSVAAVFRDHGEVGFRAHERAALREVLEASLPIVLATGGGTFVDPAMRSWVQRSARTVYLKATVDTLAARLLVPGGEARLRRPLLSGPDPLATIRRLLQERSPAYEEAELVVSTDGATPPEIVDQIIQALKVATKADRIRKKKEPEGQLELPVSEPDAHETSLSIAPDGSSLIRVHSESGDYPVELRPDAGRWLGEALAVVCKGERIAVVSDTTVVGHHGKRVTQALAANGKRVSVHTITPGESQKTLETAGLLYDELLGAGLTRGDTVVALGGGVVGDLAGFVSATYMRGIALVQMPTTTLAAVDASVGGKNAVNTPRGKNLVGTVHAPRAVLIAAAHLLTQDRRSHVAGLIEALKMAATLDAQLFADMVRDADRLAELDVPLVLRTIARAVALKAQIVARDEHETGERAVLNYGHTVGHAIEAGEHYRILHGEAVALGMMAEAEFADAAGLSRAVAPELKSALERFAAPTDWRDAHVDVDAMALDKKRSGNAVKLPVVKKVGSFELCSVPIQRLTAFVQTSIQERSAT